MKRSNQVDIARVQTQCKERSVPVPTSFDVSFDKLEKVGSYGPALRIARRSLRISNGKIASSLGGVAQCAERGRVWCCVDQDDLITLFREVSRPLLCASMPPPEHKYRRRSSRNSSRIHRGLKYAVLD